MAARQVRNIASDPRDHAARAATQVAAHASPQLRAPSMRRYSNRGVDNQLSDAVSATPSNNAKWSYPRTDSADLGYFTAQTRARRHPFRQKASSLERTAAMRHASTGKHGEERRRPEAALGPVLAKMDELNLRLQGLQRGQDDICTWVKQMRHEMTYVAQARHDLFGLGSLNTTAPSDHADHRLDPDDSSAVLDERRWPGGEPGRASVKIEVPDDAYQSECASHEYCGSGLRPEFVNLGQELAPEEALSGLVNLSENEKASRSDSEQSLNNFRANFHQRRYLSALPRPRAIHPDSRLRLWLDMAGMGVLLFDSVSVPYQLSFDPDASAGFWFVTNCLTLGVWTLDMLLGFITGYYDSGGPVLRLRDTAVHYVHTFFLFDFMLVICDWASIIFDMLLAGDVALRVKLFRILKLNRFVRLAGALQSGKFRQMYDRIINWSRQIGVDSQLMFSLNVLQLMFAILWLNHIGCCLWFSAQSTAVHNWEKDSNIEAFNKSTDSAEWEYFLGFYWSMTAMVSGASIMSPTNVGELVFTIVYVLFGLLVGSTIISSLAAMLLELQLANKEQRDNVTLLRQYLFQQGLDVGLALDVEREAVARMSKEKRLGAAEVPCLGLLSPAMRSALHYAIYCRPLKDHPFWGVCHILDSSGLFTKEICEDAIDHDTQLPGFQVFPIPDLGDACEGPFYVVLGELEYLTKEAGVATNWSAPDIEETVQPPTSPSGWTTSQSHRSTKVSPGQWLCELANWLRWSHRGSLNACVPCEYLQLKADALLKLLLRFEDLRWLAWQYATALCRAVDAEELGRLTDLPLREDLHESAVLSMKPEWRRQMAAAPLKRLKAAAKNRQPGWLSFGRAPYAKLLAQVDGGKCDLVMKSGQVMRIVSVVVLRLEREVERDGQKVRQILAQISRSTKAEDAKCQLPGGKVRAGELPSQALARLLQEQLHALRQVGLTAERLQKADNVIELTTAARPGDRDLTVSSLSDLHVSSIVQISRDRQTETREVLSLDFVNNRIELDPPLEHRYDVGTRVAKAREMKKSAAANLGDGFGVDTKYIRTVYCGSLAAEECVGRVLRRDRLEPETVDADPMADYSALLLLPNYGVDDAPSMFGARDGDTFGARGGDFGFCPVDRDDGILCAWIDETDYVSLSTKREGTERARKWVGELQASIEEVLTEEYASRSLQPPERAQRSLSSGLAMIQAQSVRSQSGSLRPMDSLESLPEDD